MNLAGAPNVAFIKFFENAPKNVPQKPGPVIPSPGQAVILKPGAVIQISKLQENFTSDNPELKVEAKTEAKPQKRRTRLNFEQKRKAVFNF